MAVIFVVAQFEGHRRLEPLTAVRGDAHAHGDAVGESKLHTAAVAAEEVRVFLHHLQRRVAVLLAQLHGQDRRQLIAGQELHEPPQPHVPAEAPGDLLGLFGGDALDESQPLRLPLQNVQGVPAKALHDPLGGGGTHALADAGGEVVEDLLLVLRQKTLQLHRPQLLPVLGMLFQNAGHRQVLSRRHAGNAAHHREDLSLLRQEAQDRIAVFGILKNDAVYGAVTGDEFFHALPLYVLLCGEGVPLR